MIDSTLNEQPVKVSKYAHSLRTHLFKEHLGLLSEQNEGSAGPPAVMREDFDVTDPVSVHFWNEVWHEVAEQNTKIYEKTFSVVPTDKVSYIHEKVTIHSSKLKGSETTRCHGLI